MGSCAPIAVPAPDDETPSALLLLAATSSATKRKRRPARTPDPEAEVVSLSPRTLLEASRYVCEICSRAFRREQNLVMHRRGHNLPWKLKKRDAAAAPRKKRVFVCPEPSCLHHQPSHALGDLTGIRKHFGRKHAAHRQWACARCSKAYAVLSDYKAHVKTCGTRTCHSTCRCGRVFTRVESLVEHLDTCSAGRPPQVVVGVDVSSASVCGVAAAVESSVQQAPPARSPSVSSPSAPAFYRFLEQRQTPPSGTNGGGQDNLELQLMPPSCSPAAPRSPPAPISRADDDVTMELRLSLGAAATKVEQSSGHRLHGTRGRATRACRRGSRATAAPAGTSANTLWWTMCSGRRHGLTLSSLLFLPAAAEPGGVCRW